MTGIVRGEYKQLGGAVAAGQLVITVNTEGQVVRDPVGNVVFQGPQAVKLNKDGLVTLTLPASDDSTLEPSGFTYAVVEQLSHVARTSYRIVEFQVTNGGTIQLADLAATDEAALDPSYGANLNAVLAELDGRLSEGDLAASFAPVSTDLTNGATGAIARPVVDKLAAIIEARDFGAAGNGATDDTTAIQKAIDAATAAGGGIVNLTRGPLGAAIYRVTSVTLKSGVTLRGQIGMFPYAASPVTLSSVTAGAALIDTPVTNISGAAIEGLRLDGGGVASRGIRLRSANQVATRNCIITAMTDQAWLHEAGYACVMEDVLALNCLQATNRATPAGVIELRGTDDLIDRVEVSGSQTAITTTANSVAVLVAGDANFLSNVIGEIADSGFYISGYYNMFSNCRGDLNFGHGWRFEGTGGQQARNILSNCHALNNGRATANTYSGFNFNLSGRNQLTGCMANTNGAGGSSHKYGYYDGTSYGGADFRQRLANCDSFNAVTDAYGYADKSKGMAVLNPLAQAAGTDLATTHNVTGVGVLTLANSAATTITAFTGGFVGQVLKVIAGNGNTTVQNGSTINTNTGANKTLTANRLYTFTNVSGGWIENA